MFNDPPPVEVGNEDGVISDEFAHALGWMAALVSGDADVDYHDGERHDVVVPERIGLHTGSIDEEHPEVYIEDLSPEYAYALGRAEQQYLDAARE